MHIAYCTSTSTSASPVQCSALCSGRFKRKNLLVRITTQSRYHTVPYTRSVCMTTRARVLDPGIVTWAVIGCHVKPYFSLIDARARARGL